MVACDSQDVTSYWCSVVTGLGETVVELQAVKISRNNPKKLRVHKTPSK